MTSLNPQQREAVLHVDGPLLVLAGAGSGKTRVLTERIAHLIRDQGVPPNAILAATFTNKAAREMRARVERVLGGSASGIWLATFHSLCARLLRIEGHGIGLPRDFAIYDDSDQSNLVKQIASELNLSEELYPPARLRAGIDRAKNEGQGPDDLSAAPWDPITARLAEVYKRYQELLKSYGAVDFGDLLLRPVQLFEEHPDVLQRYQQRFRYILVDEYQDTNRVQYRFLQLLAATHRNLCVVGDDDQSIYKWRGADVRNILDFERDFPGAEVVRLEQNYRSTQVILDAAGSVIANNRARKGKRLWTENGRGDLVRAYTASDEQDEARYVCREIERLRATGKPLSDFAVFYRTNAQSRPFEEELIRRALPYAIVGATKFYDRKEVKDLLAYLRVVANPLDTVSLTRIINTPPRGIGRTTLDILTTNAKEMGQPLFDLVIDPTGAGLSVSLARKVTEFSSVLRRLRDLREGPVTTLLQRAIDETGYIGWLDDGTPEGSGRAENVRELLSVTAEFDASAEGGLSAFLEQVALVADIDSLEDGGDRMTLMTLHNSKGLEFPIVFIAGMEEGLFPHDRSKDDPESVEEERRLCYVGMTRARQSLYLLHALRRPMYGRWQDTVPSRFLSELDPELLSQEGSAPSSRRDDDDGGDGVRVDYSYSQLSPGEWTHPRRKPPAATPTSSGPMRIGTEVRHADFGLGVVRAVEGSGDSAKVVVHFARGGLKKLMVRYARLEIVGG